MSGRRKLIAGLCVGTACMIIVSGAFYKKSLTSATVLVGSRAYHLEIANTPASRQKGLGERATMAQSAGMLFVFPSASTLCFWMKGMHFPLDMIWVNSNKQVIHIEQNVQPDTYPRSFCSNNPAKYVIELSAGQVAAAHLRANQQLNF